MHAYMYGSDAEGDAATRELPIELLTAVFSHLDVRERCRASGTCRRWCQAALEPPHSTTLSLVVAGDVREGDPKPALGRLMALLQDANAPAAARNELEALRPRALSTSAAAAVLAAPVCAGIERLHLDVLLASPQSSFLRWETDLAAFCLDALFDAAPGTLAELDIHFPTERAFDLGAPFALFAPAVARRCPRLRALALSGYGGAGWVACDAKLVALPALESLGALLLEADAARLAERLPALRRLYGIHALERPPPVPPAIATVRALAARGVACRCLLLYTAVADGSIDLRGPGALAAAAALLRPACASPALGPAKLGLEGCTPPAEWPDAAFAGVEIVEMMEVPLGPAALRWLAARAPGLRSLSIQCDLQGAGPLDLLPVLEALPDGARADLRISSQWPRAESARLLEAVMGSGRLLRAAGVAFRALEPDDALLSAAFDRYLAARSALEPPG